MKDEYLIVVNRDGREVKVARLRLEYRLKPLAYDRREVSSEPRRVVEDIAVDRVLMPGAALRVKLRDVEEVERVCLELVGEGIECYQPSRGVARGSEDKAGGAKG